MKNLRTKVINFFIDHVFKDEQTKKSVSVTPLSEDCGDHMLLSEFVTNCKDGLFIDYDGYGHYATRTHVTNIVVTPTDIMRGKIRTSFSHVMWYNK